MNIFYQKVTIVVSTKNESISRDHFNELNSLFDEGKKIPNTLPVQEGIWYNHFHTFTTRNVKSFLDKIDEFRNKNPEINIVINYKRTIDIPYVLNIKNLIFPKYVTIRYTLGKVSNPESFKDYLSSSLSSENLPDSEFIGNDRFSRFKIRFKVKDLDKFQRDFSTFKNNRQNIDVSEEYETTSIKTYANFVILIAAILLWISRADEIINWFKGIV